MTYKNHKIYGPKERGFFEMEPTTIKAHSKNDYSTLPDPVQDPIVSNNISNAEFDYTYSDILKTSEDDEY